MPAENDSRNGQMPQEQPAVRTTIVGGRPPGAGKGIGPIPRGIEVLVKKASVDPAFRKRLIEVRDAAAGDIGLQLTPTEAAMLRGIPQTQLEAIINNTRVEPQNIAAFLGKAAAAMLLALGVITAGCPVEQGQRPDPTPTPQSLPAVKDLHTTDTVFVPEEGTIIMAGLSVIDLAPKLHVNEAATSHPTTDSQPATQPPVSRGIRPDVPPPSPAGIRPDNPTPPPPPPPEGRPDFSDDQ